MGSFGRRIANKAKERDLKPVVTAKCVGCGKTREIQAGEIAPDDMPMCDECYMPMVAEKAEWK